MSNRTATTDQSTKSFTQGAMPPCDSLTSFRAWQIETRQRLRGMLGIPETRVDLDAEPRGQVTWDGVVIEKWVFTCEAGSRAPAVLYRPQVIERANPAIVLTFGHGGSKSRWQYSYAGQLFARMGLACLAIDPIGEEERHIEGLQGTRSHDPQSVSDRADRAGRLIMGKLVFDTMRGVDFLLDRDDIDARRIGVAGNSLGGAKASWMAALDPRLQMAIVSGWVFDDVVEGKLCTRLPQRRMREMISWHEFIALAAPDCALLVLNGDSDTILYGENPPSWTKMPEKAIQVYEHLGASGRLRAWFRSDSGHRPYFIQRESMRWIQEHIGSPAMTREELDALPIVNGGVWCDRHGITLEPLYATEHHQRGTDLPEIGLRPVPCDVLACLAPDEIGKDEFTLEGWLRQIGQ
jgi:dienelactone hydrolase